MHRLSGVARHSNTSSKIINLSVINTQRDPVHRRRFLDGKDSTSSATGPRFRVLSGNLPNGYRNHCQTGLVDHVVARNWSTFHIHPEKLIQIMKERDGQSLCSYYDSDGYKMKAVDVVEEQRRVINESAPQNAQEEADVTYEHMLSCAQPRKKPKVFLVQDQQEHDVAKMSDPKKSLIKRLLRVERGRHQQDSSTSEKQAEKDQSSKKIAKVKESKKKYRKRTTIVPLFLKKIQKPKPKQRTVFEASSTMGRDEDFRENKPDIKVEWGDNVPLNITKSEYKINDEERAQRAQKLLKEKVLNVDYENEVVRGIKPKSKYATGSEEERHWYQNPSSPTKFENGIGEIPEFGPGKRNDG